MTPIAVGPDREPRCDMEAADVVEIVERLEDVGIPVWLDGGWGVDALLGEQTRPHDDLDLVAELAQVDALQATLRESGYEVAGGGAPMSFEMVDPDGRQVDVHPVVFTESRDGVYRMRNGEDWIYPAPGFEGAGTVLGHRVRCLTPEAQMLCHGGYEPRPKHFHDVAALSGRFGLPVPGEYRR